MTHRRGWRGVGVALAVAAGVAGLVAGAVAGAGPAGASGGSGGGGTGGGGSSSCTGPTTVAVADNLAGLTVAPYWQPNGVYGALASGTASKACDSLPVIVQFTDTVLAGDPACAAVVPDYRNPLYFKYGLKPPSRYESTFSFATGSDCVGQPHSMLATMVNTASGAVLGTASVDWVPA